MEQPKSVKHAAKTINQYVRYIQLKPTRRSQRNYLLSTTSYLTLLTASRYLRQRPRYSGFTIDLDYSHGGGG